MSQELSFHESNSRCFPTRLTGRDELATEYSTRMADHRMARLH